MYARLSVEQLENRFMPSCAGLVEPPTAPEPALLETVSTIQLAPLPTRAELESRLSEMIESQERLLGSKLETLRAGRRALHSLIESQAPAEAVFLIIRDLRVGQASYRAASHIYRDMLALLPLPDESPSEGIEELYRQVNVGLRFGQDELDRATRRLVDTRFGREARAFELIQLETSIMVIEARNEELRRERIKLYYVLTGEQL